MSKISSYFHLPYGIGSASRKIGRELVKLNHTVNPNLHFSMIVRFTRKGVELTPANDRHPFNDRQPFGIGYDRLSDKLRDKLKGRGILLNPSVEGWMIDKCFRSLIKWGPEKSCDTLQSNGISILGESPDIKMKNLL